MTKSPDDRTWMDLHRTRGQLDRRAMRLRARALGTNKELRLISSTEDAGLSAAGSRDLSPRRHPPPGNSMLRRSSRLLNREDNAAEVTASAESGLMRTCRRCAFRLPWTVVLEEESRQRK